MRRFLQNPIIHPGLDETIGDNINGPSLIRVPWWVENALGRYYLYFAHHRGDYIRLAYADRLEGRWRVYRSGTLRLDQTPCQGHIASPDVHVDDDRREIVMYYHGGFSGEQKTFLAVSKDGLTFRSVTGPLGPFYFRVFKHDSYYYAIAKSPNSECGGIILRSCDGRSLFEPGKCIIPYMRHAGVLKRGNTLIVFFSRGGDCPERILGCRVDITGYWDEWTVGEIFEVLAPEIEYEGASLPLEPSRFGPAPGPVRQLRDPAPFCDDGELYLVYSCAGESGLAIAQLYED